MLKDIFLQSVFPGKQKIFVRLIVTPVTIHRFLTADSFIATAFLLPALPSSRREGRISTIDRSMTVMIQVVRARYHFCAPYYCRILGNAQARVGTGSGKTVQQTTHATIGIGATAPLGCTPFVGMSPSAGSFVIDGHFTLGPCTSNDQQIDIMLSVARKVSTFELSVPDGILLCGSRNPENIQFRIHMIPLYETKLLEVE